MKIKELILVNLGAKSAMMDNMSNYGKDNRILKNQRILFCRVKAVCFCSQKLVLLFLAEAVYFCKSISEEFLNIFSLKSFKGTDFQ